VLAGTGLLGRHLAKELLASGCRVAVATRNRQAAAGQVEDGVELVEWDGRLALFPADVLEAVDGVVNFSGESIGNRRWSASVKREIVKSRVESTRSIVKGINEGMIRPKVFINASAVGYYGPHRDEVITESEAPGQDFLAEVCRQWEAEAYQVQSPLTRVATLRIGVVLGSQGALARMTMPYKFYAGGPLGKGEQWLSWIHVQDLVRMLSFILEEDRVSGPVNGTAPNPVTMRDFAKILGEVLGRPAWLPVPGFLLKIALGQMSEMLLHGQRAVPEKILEAGFAFKYPDLRGALEDLLI